MHALRNVSQDSCSANAPCCVSEDNSDCHVWVKPLLLPCRLSEGLKLVMKAPLQNQEYCFAADTVPELHAQLVTHPDPTNLRKWYEMYCCYGTSTLGRGNLAVWGSTDCHNRWRPATHLRRSNNTFSPDSCLLSSFLGKGSRMV